MYNYMHILFAEVILLKFLGKKIVSLALATLMIVLVAAPANAVTASVSGKKNDGARDVNAGLLSEQAKAYYTDEVKSYITDEKVYQTFKDLADNQANNDKDSYQSMQSNDLFETLYNIMSSTHTHSVSYPGTGNNSLAHYWLTTDTSSANYTDNRGVYTFFYSNVDDYGNANMQREHIWPKSKASFLMKAGLGGSDLHHLRPSYAKVNNIKSNWGFGDIKTETGNGQYTYNSGWKNKRTVLWPDSDDNKQVSLWRADTVENGKTYTYIDVKDDVRGDVARILLYIYTRWKQPNLYTDLVDSNGDPETNKLPEPDPDDTKNTGERVIQSKEVLLKWMKNDPVSEWEMKRNDLTEDIQGNRNVFIDYPELAWLLFDETPPSDMDTPSGMAKGAGTDIAKKADVVINDPVTPIFTLKKNGVASITAFNNTTQKHVKLTIKDKNSKTIQTGDKVARGDSITYTVVPDESVIDTIRFNKTSGNGIYQSYPLTDGKFTFTKKAGFKWEDDTKANSETEENFYINLNSLVCELSIKISGLSSTGKSTGSGSGMVTAMYASGEKKNQIIENGSTVPNGTKVRFTFTPDYGSRYYSLGTDTTAATKIEGTESYTYTDTLDCSDNNEYGAARQKKYNVKFAATFPGNNSTNYISNKGMRPNENDTVGQQADFTSNFEICGVQLKKDADNAENRALRFVSVIDKKILSKAQSYGYVIGYTKRINDTDGDERRFVNKSAYSLTVNLDEQKAVTSANYGIAVDCTGTDNTVSGEYGMYSTDTDYKYITASVNNIQNAGEIGENTTIIARPYVVLKDEYHADGSPQVIYGQYVDFSSGEDYCACSGSYRYIKSLAAAQ